MTDLGNIVMVIMTVRDQLKIYHWQTSNYARHKSCDHFVNFLTGIMDKLVETIQGARENRLIINENNQENNIFLINQTDNSIIDLLKTFKLWLNICLPKYFLETDTDLFSIRDEILVELNKTLYLFSLV